MTMMWNVRRGTSHVTMCRTGTVMVVGGMDAIVLRRVRVPVERVKCRGLEQVPDRRLRTVGMLRLCTDSCSRLRDWGG